MNLMTVRILAFGIAKEIVGASFIDVVMNDGLTVRKLQGSLEERFPGLKQLASYRIALNNEFANAEQPVQAQDEIAIIPPVSGG
jgi:molybdopterin synthase sulfur carrier subunit